MLKKLILIITCTVTLNANVNTIIKDILGSHEYIINENLINYIFKDSSYYIYERVDYNVKKRINYIALTSKLQNNSLLKLKYDSSKYIDVSFEITGIPKKSLLILKDSLKSLGHYFYLVQDVKYNKDSFIWTIKLKTEAAINPLRLTRALENNNCQVSYIKREGDYNWKYIINSDNSSIYQAADLITENKLSLNKPLRPYLLKVSNANYLEITSNRGNRWHPDVIFYDNDLNIIENFKDNSLHQRLKIDVPNNTTYIKINDLYSLANLKRGISITKE